MKTEPEKYRLKRTLKIANISNGRPFGDSGLCPKNPQGTCPLTHYRALPEPVLAGRQEKGAVAPFPLNRIIREPYVKRLSRHILTLRVPVFHGPLDIRFRSVYAVVCFWRFKIVCWPRKINSCHFPGILSAPSSISTLLRTL